MSDDLSRRQSERWNDLKTRDDAQARANLVTPPAARLRSQYDAMRRAPKVEQRIFWLREMAGTWGASVAPVAACKSGCAACCRQSVLLTEPEAKMIAKETGATYHAPAKWRGSEPATEYSGKPCPFLGADERCTIYASRPFACRVLFNLDRDALLCEIIPGAAASVPYANAMSLNLAYVEGHVPDMKALREQFSGGASVDDLARAAVHWADLREFFPEGLK